MVIFLVGEGLLEVPGLDISLFGSPSLGILEYWWCQYTFVPYL